jgi:hypothetical protein
LVAAGAGGGIGDLSEFSEGGLLRIEHFLQIVQGHRRLTPTAHRPAAGEGQNSDGHEGRQHRLDG